MVSVVTGVAILWFGIELVEKVFGPRFDVKMLGQHHFDGPHVLAIWYVAMTAVTLSLILLFIAVWRAEQADDALIARSARRGENKS